MNKFVLKPTSIDGLKVIERLPIKDERGSFERFFCQESLGQFFRGKTIRQINRTFTKKKGTVRGLHFQYSPYAETKIVTCLKGKVWDVAVDLRQGSRTFLHYHEVLLTDKNNKSYLIPEGFAHGFQTLTINCEMIYIHNVDYHKESEGALNALDPALKIKWPNTITHRSQRDKSHLFLKKDFKGIYI